MTVESDGRPAPWTFRPYPVLEAIWESEKADPDSMFLGDKGVPNKGLWLNIMAMKGSGHVSEADLEEAMKRGRNKS